MSVVDAAAHGYKEVPGSKSKVPSKNPGQVIFAMHSNFLELGTLDLELLFTPSACARKASMLVQ